MSSKLSKINHFKANIRKSIEKLIKSPFYKPFLLKIN